MLTAIAYQLRREIDAAHEQAEALVALATEQGFALFRAIGGILRDGTRTALGQRAEQIDQIRQDLAAVREMRSAVYAQDGQVEAGRATLDEALAGAHSAGQRMVEAETGCSAPWTSPAARRRSRWSCGPMSLSRFWHQAGKRQEAHDLLPQVYAWFTEGFDTADLQEARALLEELA